MHLNNNKNVRFDVRAEAALAAHDYRVAHATRKAIRYTTELHKTFAVSIQNHTSFGPFERLTLAEIENKGLKIRRKKHPSPRCLKITEKVSFNIASEASYVYILSRQKLIKNAKNGPFWQVFENLKLAVKQCYQTGQFK